jgi:enamine deaminase RidA (YjgF/YER057c/UK114 family)
MNKSHFVGSVALPAAKFAHAVEVPPGARLLYTSGLIGVALDGKLRQGCEAQAMQAWENLLAVMRNAHMGLEDIVQMTTYCVNAADNSLARRTRNDFIPGYDKASTILVVAALSLPECLFEIEAVAAKAVP